MDAKKLKLLLRHKYRLLVLDDMVGPVDVNGSLVMTAVIRAMDEHETEETLAKKIAADADEKGKDCHGPVWFSFYRIDEDEGNVRYALLMSPWTTHKDLTKSNAGRAR